VDTSGSLAKLIQREKVISVQDVQQKKIEKRKLEQTKARIRDLEKQMDLGNEEGQKRAGTRLEKEREKERTANLVFDRTKKTKAQWCKERRQYKKALMDNIKRVVVNIHICSECKLPHEKDMIRLYRSSSVGSTVYSLQSTLQRFRLSSATDGSSTVFSTTTHSTVIMSTDHLLLHRDIYYH
jgi:hypothetical protein